VHKLVKPVESDSPGTRRRLYSGLAIAAAIGLAVAVVGYSIGGTAGSGGQPAATALQAAQQDVTGAAAAQVPAQTSPVSAGSTGNSSSAQESTDTQQSAKSGSRDPMAPADLKHLAAPQQSPLKDDSQQVLAPLLTAATGFTAFTNSTPLEACPVRLNVPAVMSGQLLHCSVSSTIAAPLG
jgi:hypothetical protein